MSMTLFHSISVCQKVEKIAQNQKKMQKFEKYQEQQKDVSSSDLIPGKGKAACSSFFCWHPARDAFLSYFFFPGNFSQYNFLYNICE